MIITSHIKSSLLAIAKPDQSDEKKTLAEPRDIFSRIDENKDLTHERFRAHKRFERFKRHLDRFKDWRMPEQPECYIRAKRHGLL